MSSLNQYFVAILIGLPLCVLFVFCKRVFDVRCAKLNRPCPQRSPRHRKLFGRIAALLYCPAVLIVFGTLFVVAGWNQPDSEAPPDAYDGSNLVFVPLASFLLPALLIWLIDTLFFAPLPSPAPAREPAKVTAREMFGAPSEILTAKPLQSSFFANFRATFNRFVAKLASLLPKLPVFTLKPITKSIVLTSIVTALLTVSFATLFAPSTPQRRAEKLARSFINDEHDACPSLEEIKLLPGPLQAEIITLREKYLIGSESLIRNNLGTGEEREAKRAAYILNKRQEERQAKEAARAYAKAAAYLADKGNYSRDNPARSLLTSDEERLLDEDTFAAVRRKYFSEMFPAFYEIWRQEGAAAAP